MDTYEKKYNEALERAKKIHDEIVNNEVIGFPGQITDIFPELRESEDERIRKWLVDYFGSIKETVWIHRDITCGQILAWLEKKKEQKPAEKQDYSGLNDLERAIHRGFLCAGVENVPVTIIKDTAAECMGFLALIEPKPAWSEEDEFFRQQLIVYCEKGIQDPLAAKCVDWLKSLHPSWKPSEEQMEAMEFVIKDYREDGCTATANYLQEILDQIKKL